MTEIALTPIKIEEDPLARLLNSEWDRYSSSRIRYPGFWLSEKGLGSTEEILDAVLKTRKMCMNAGISIGDHFREVYVCNQGKVYKTWMLSDFALKLTIVHIDSDSPILAKLQINMLK